MGVRAEHPQRLIDSIQYHMPERGEYLPAAAYSLVAQVGGRGVYSFCMCPGGFIVPAMTRSGESVVNGMSPSGRNSVYANSGIVTEIRPEDFAHLRAAHGELAGLRFQQQLESWLMPRSATGRWHRASGWPISCAGRRRKRCRSVPMYRVWLRPRCTGGSPVYFRGASRRFCRVRP